MYKLLLCWRYLKTRYIALASIISVMLGVATMIVGQRGDEGVHSRNPGSIHGILSDMVLETASLEGLPNADLYMQRIRKVAGQYIDGMSPTVSSPRCWDTPITQADTLRSRSCSSASTRRPTPV